MSAGARLHVVQMQARGAAEEGWQVKVVHVEPVGDDRVDVHILVDGVARVVRLSVHASRDGLWVVDSESGSLLDLLELYGRDRTRELADVAVAAVNRAEKPARPS